MANKSEINKEIEKNINNMRDWIKEVSIKTNKSEKEVEQRLRETYEAVSKPTLDNIDYPHYGKCNFDMDEFKSE